MKQLYTFQQVKDQDGDRLKLKKPSNLQLVKLKVLFVTVGRSPALPAVWPPRVSEEVIALLD